MLDPNQQTNTHLDKTVVNFRLFVGSKPNGADDESGTTTLERGLQAQVQQHSKQTCSHTK